MAGDPFKPCIELERIGSGSAKTESLQNIVERCICIDQDLGKLIGPETETDLRSTLDTAGFRLTDLVRSTTIYTFHDEIRLSELLFLENKNRIPKNRMNEVHTHTIP